MRKFYLSIITLLCLVVTSNVAYGQGTETFDAIGGGTSSSYLSRSWTGNDGSTWTATRSRVDQTINSDAITMNDDEANVYVQSGTITGGVGNLTISTQRKFSGGSGNLNILINGSNVGTVPYGTSVQTTTISGINVSGNIVIRIDNNIGGSSGGGADRVAIDDVTWTAYSASTPTISVTPSAITGLNYVFGSGPSVGQSYSISGINLTPATGSITVTAPTNFSVSTTLGGSYTPSITIPYTGNTLSATNVFVRLNAGLGVATYGPLNVTNAGGGAVTQNVSVTGTVTPAPPANDLCSNATALTIGAAPISGTLINATPTSSNSFMYQTAANDVWYTFSPACTGTHTVTVSFSGVDIDFDVFPSVCPTSGTAPNVAHTTNNPETVTASFNAGTTYSIRVIDYNNVNAAAFNIDVASSAVPQLTLSNTGSPAATTITAAAPNSVLYGFELNPNGCATTYNFTDITITKTGTSTASEVNNLRIFYDANNNGIVDGAESSVSNTIGVSGSLVFTMSGQTGLSGARRYLLVGDVLSSTPGTTTFTASATAADITSNISVTGSANGNTQTFLTLKPEPTNYPTSFACGTTTSSSIPLTWTDATGGTIPDGYLIKWSTGAITPPSDGTAEANGAGVQNVVHIGGSNSYTATGLAPSTTYNFSIWSYTNSGSNIDYKLVSEPQTSCATIAGPTCLATQDFDGTNTWTYSSDVTFFDNGFGSDGFYGINPIGSSSPLANAGFSGNILAENDLDDEGDNGTTGFATTTFAIIDVSNYNTVTISFDYDIEGYNANDDDAKYEIFHDGIGQGEVFILDGDGAAEDATGSVLETVPNSVSDVYLTVSIRNNGGTGYSGFDNFSVCGILNCLAPTTEASNVSFTTITETTADVSWTNGNGSDRAIFIKQDNTGSPSPIDNTTYSANTVFGLGDEIGSTGWYCIYNGNTGTSATVTGLTGLTDYQVMVVEYNCVPGDEKYLTSTTINNPNTFTTLAPVVPTIFVSTTNLSDYGSQCINTTSGVQSYIVSGINLLNDIVITAPAGFEIKAIGAVSYGTTVNIPHFGGTVNDTTINVRFVPTVIGNYEDTITHTSTLTTLEKVGVMGDGINTSGSVTTTAITNVLTTTATSGGESLLAGCSAITQKGVVWGTSPNPTIASDPFTNDGSGIASYSSALTALTSNTTYYYRAYIIDGSGTVYGNELSFITLKDEPTNHPTAFACGTTTTTTIPLTWTDAIGGTAPDGYLIKWSIISYASITDPVDGTPEANGPNTQNVAQGVGTYTVTGLTTNAAYYFKIYPYTNSGTFINYKTSATIAETTCSTLNGPCIDEDFVDFTDWTDNGTAEDNVTTHAGPISGIPCRGMGTGANIISPTVNNPLLLEFFQDASGGGNGNTATVDYRIGAGAWTLCHSFVVTTAGNTESVDLTNISGVNLSVQNNVSFRFNSTFSTWYLDDVVVTCGTPDAEINVSGNGQEIMHLDFTPEIADDTEFGNIAVVGGTSSHTFTIENTGGLDLILDGFPIVNLANGTDFTVSVQPSDDSLSNAETTTFVITFDPSVTGTIVDTVKISNNDSDEDPYTFVIQGTGTNSNSSDIVTNTSFTYTSDIPYLSYQDPGPFTNTTGNLGVFQFDIRDGGSSGDADLLGTELTDITFSVGTTHINYIRNAALFDGNAMRANSPVINTIAGTISFSGLSGANFTAGDDGSLRLTLRVSFLTTVTDNEKLIFTITAASTDPTGSAFAVGNAGGAFSDNNAGNNRNRIEVVATALAFSQQPSDAAVNVTMTPSVTVSGVDVNSNLDLDWTGNVSISSSLPGNMTGEPIVETASDGIATFNTGSGIVHTIAGAGYTLTASSGVFLPVGSNPFEITTIVFNNGDYRTTGNSTWLSGGVAPWERLSSGTWSASTAPNYNTSNTAYIRAGHTVTTGGSYGSSINIVVQDGGRFNSNHPGTTNSIEVNDGGIFAINTTLTNNGTLEVEDNATLIFNYQSGNGSENIPSLWDGTEIFHPNSTIIFNDFDCADDYLVPDNTSISPNTFAGYTAVFGNIILDFGSSLSPSDDWKMLDGGVTVNMAHGDLIFRSNDESAADMRLATTGTVTSGIGGDFIVEDGYNNTSNINLKTSGNLTFTILGNMQLDAATTRVVAGANGTSTINIEGDLNITPSAVLNFNSTVSTVPIAIVNLKGDVTVAGSGLLTNSNSSRAGEFNFVGIGDGLTDATTQTIDIASTSSLENRVIAFNAEAGSYVKQINRDFELGTNSSLVVKFNAVYDFGFNGTTALNLTISGSQTGTIFSSRLGSTLKITNPDGINGTGFTGNVQTVPSNRSFNQVATFHYIGKVNQVTGNAITTGSSAKIIICELIDNNTQLSFTNSTGITSTTTISPTGGKLDIRVGQVIESTTAYITATDGTLYMQPGTLYQIAKGNSTAALSNADPIPRLVGATFPYVLTGGTIELIGSTAGNNFQTLRGTQLRPNYINIKFSGSNTLGVNYKNLTSTSVIENELIVTGSAVVDCINSAGIATSFIGDGALVMDGGRLRIKKLNTPNPELDGIAADYVITGGTVEFYGTNSTESQLIRGTDSRTTPRTISYFNIELNANQANGNSNPDPSLNYNVGLAAGIEITGTMNVNRPTVFQTDRLDHIDGTGVFNVRTGATYKYGDEFGITLGNSTALSAGAIRVSSNRTIANFPITASYGFVGTTNMVTGNALPTQVSKIYLQKASNELKVTLSNDLVIADTLMMQRGNILVKNQDFELGTGTSTTTKGFLDYRITDEPFVIGTMKRWFNTATNSGNASGLFPLGDTTSATGNDIHNRFALIEYSSAKSAGGSLTARFVNIPMSYLGIPINGIAAAGGCPIFDVTSTEDQGYWRIDDGDGLTGGNYDITCTGEGFNNIVDLCQITLIKRVNGGIWFENGNHLQPFYLNGNSAQPTVSRQGASGWSNYGFGGGEANLLPVELISFTAENLNNNSLLNWITDSELNNDYFEVEHSLNAIDFTKIGEVNGNGTTNSQNYYDHTHVTPPIGINYYRLRQVDFDGSFAYSPIRSVLIENSGENSMQVVNTLAQNDLILQFLSTKDKKGNLVIYAANGQVVSQRELNLSTGGTQISVDISQLPSALYIVQWYNGNEIIEEKFIKKY